MTEQLTSNKFLFKDKIFFVFFAIFYLIYSIQSPLTFIGANFIAVIVMLKFGLINDLRKASNLFNIFFFLFCILGLSIFNFFIFNEELVRYFSVSFILFQFVFLFVANNNYSPTSFKVKKNNIILKLYLLFFIYIGFLSAFIFYYKTGFIPILKGLTPDERVAVQAGNGFYLQFVRFGIYSSLIFYFFTKKKFLYFIVFLILNLAMLGTGFRGEFVQFFFFFCLCVIVLKKIKVSIFKLFFLGLFTLVFVVSLEYLRTKEDSDFFFFVLFNFGHSLSVAVYNFDFIIQRFDNFQWGLTFFHNFSMFLPGPDVDYTNWLTKQVEMNFKGGITPTIIGDFYVNFSKYLYIGIVFFAFFIKKVENKIVNNQNSILETVFWVNISLLFARTVTGGLSNQTIQIFMTSIFILGAIIVNKIMYESNTST